MQYPVYRYFGGADHLLPVRGGGGGREGSAHVEKS